MGTITQTSARRMTAKSSVRALPPLVPGEHLDQKTFHARYEAMAPETRAELIEGIVHMSSPMKRPHGRGNYRLIQWLAAYEDATPGVEGFDSATNILGEYSEPQPDACLLILASHGGQTRSKDDYIVGAPEWVGEIAASTADIDLGAKLRDYERAGVKEYVVVALRQKQVRWFVLHHGKFTALQPGPDGILRSEVFPGLWLDSNALVREDGRRLLAVLREGLATPDHAVFVGRLAARAAKRRGSAGKRKKR